MAVTILGNFKRIYCMVKALRPTQMVRTIMGNSGVGRGMAKGRWYRRMVLVRKASGVRG